jgi:NADH dehydrogenase/NADH:ubiquinone oxidoreductase subunit G
MKIKFNGREIECNDGQSISGAIMASGQASIFCGIGACFACVVTVDGIPNQRACLIDVRDGMVITQ